MPVSTAHSSSCRSAVALEPGSVPSGTKIARALPSKVRSRRAASTRTALRTSACFGSSVSCSMVQPSSAARRRCHSGWSSAETSPGTGYIPAV